MAGTEREEKKLAQNFRPSPGGQMNFFLTTVTRCALLIVLGLNCSAAQAADTQQRLADACPGLEKYSNDLSPITSSRASMRGFEGGTEFNFKVAEHPSHLPSPLNVRSAGHVCAIAVNKDASCAYTSKRACRAICTGMWPEDENGEHDREIELTPDGCASDAPAAKLLTKRLNASAIIRGLPLVNHQNRLSDSGRRKQLWDIRGHDTEQFEIIGNDQSDADVVAWQCADYNAQGNRRVPSKGTRCYAFFVSVLGKIVSKPEAVADALIARGGSEGTTSNTDYADISIETDGLFYFVRRLSRQ